MKQGEIDYKGNVISYKIKRHKKARCMKLTVKSDATVMVTAPNLISELLAKNFVIQKAEWILKSLSFFDGKKEGLIKLPSSGQQGYKHQAKKLILERLEFFNQHYNYQYNRVSVRDQRSRWGSCSGKKNLNFNYRLFLLPLDLTDYVIVHELCHLGEMNHSSNFWKLVSEVVPDYKIKRKKLKDYIW